MKIKKIRIKSRSEFDEDLHSVAHALDNGKTPPKPFRGEYFESLDAVRSVLTDRRLELWRTVRDEKPKSISQLAEMVGRSFRTVHRDMKLLESLGLISFKKGKGERGDTQHPVSLVDELVLAVA